MNFQIQSSLTYYLFHGENNVEKTFWRICLCHSQSSLPMFFTFRIKKINKHSTNGIFNTVSYLNKSIEIKMKSFAQVIYPESAESALHADLICGTVRPLSIGVTFLLLLSMIPKVKRKRFSLLCHIWLFYFMQKLFCRWQQGKVSLMNSQEPPWMSGTALSSQELEINFLVWYLPSARFLLLSFGFFSSFFFD